MEGTDPFALVPYSEFSKTLESLSATEGEPEAERHLHAFVSRLDDGNYWITKYDSAIEPLLNLGD